MGGHCAWTRQTLTKIKGLKWCVCPFGRLKRNFCGLLRNTQNLDLTAPSLGPNAKPGHMPFKVWGLDVHVKVRNVAVNHHGLKTCY